ncbi:hypothetical protein PoB_005363100 [Plakobranchus ocellatus]|uniref:Uncharacterized protein n=1 Tax=Plakobranchus ocellatus TaxID=259542 RepID=A0AAV4C2Z0_9GAST|nr:hypothetical protein PoB_005363100 [Plakobranchus ocellatus]
MDFHCPIMPHHQLYPDPKCDFFYMHHRGPLGEIPGHNNDQPDDLRPSSLARARARSLADPNSCPPGKNASHLPLGRFCYPLWFLEIFQC